MSNATISILIERFKSMLSQVVTRVNECDTARCAVVWGINIANLALVLVQMEVVTSPAIGLFKACDPLLQAALSAVILAVLAAEYVHSEKKYRTERQKRREAADTRRDELLQQAEANWLTRLNNNRN